MLWIQMYELGGHDRLEFIPERFSGSDISSHLKRQLFTLGMGHRQCVGKELAYTMISYLLSNIVLDYTLTLKYCLGTYNRPGRSGA
jgi:cytochrome P450